MASRKAASRPRKSPLLLLFLMLFILLGVLPTTADGLTQTLCSTINTGSGSGEVYTYQSNGHCSSQCSGYAYGIVQNEDCWCSNYAPADTVSVSECSQQCPGYPFENCGNQDKSLYGYVALGPSPSGTLGGSSSQAASTTTDKSSTAAASTSSDTTTTSSSNNAQTTSPTPVISTLIVSVSGSIMTHTVTTMPTSQAQTKSTKKGLSGGVIAAIVVVVVIVLGILLGLGIWWLRKWLAQRDLTRRYNEEVKRFNVLEGYSGPSPTRTRPVSVSTNSALMAGGLPRLNVSLDPDDISPVDNRSSGGLYHFYQHVNQGDSRLAPIGGNESRTSFNDGVDYTRKLEVRNPGPRDNESISINEA